MPSLTTIYSQLKNHIKGEPLTYKPNSLASLISKKNRDIFLPHIQRPFVWELDQVYLFLDSLMKNYPIQTFLFWKTTDAIKARKFMDDIVEDPDLSDYYEQGVSEEGHEKVFVLDGQQRLQSLFSTFSGTFYGQDLYINISDGASEIENGLSYTFELSSTGLNLPFFKIKSLVTDRRNAEDIADEVNDKLNSILTSESPSGKNLRQRQVRHNIGQLVSILREDKHFWVDELDGTTSSAYPYNTVLNVFIRVNSGGTKLEAADLMFAAMKESWADVEQNIEQVVENLNQTGRTGFDKSFVLKCLMSAISKGATLSSSLFLGLNGDANIKTIEQEWPKLESAFSQLRDFIKNDLKIYSDKVIRSYNSFIPIFEYFFFHHSPTPEARAMLKSYYYRSQLFNWYSKGTDQIIDAMHNILYNNKDSELFPMGNVKSYFADQGKESELTIGHLKDNRLRFIVLNLVYVERIGSSPFDVRYKGNKPHIDHIYPKSKLKTYPTSDVNHIGNYRFVGANDNLRKRAEDPSSYFTRLKASGVDISPHLLVTKYSDDSSLLTDSNYVNFRDKRLSAIFDICARIVNL